jgi:serine protease
MKTLNSYNMNKKNLLWFAFVLVFAISCTQDESQKSPDLSLDFQEPIAARLINDKINQVNQSGGKFDWKQASLHELWSAIHHGKYLVSIGFGTHETDFDRTKNNRANQQQAELIKLMEQYEGGDVQLIYADEFLNNFDVVLKKPATLLALRKHRLIRYVEPADYRYFSLERESGDFQVQSSSGCGYSTATISAADATTITPNARLPWAFGYHGIPSAWNISTGQGITIGVVDTGLSPNQSLLNSSFNSGASSGRFVQRFGTYVDSIWPWSTTTDGPNDLCGHGTSMASVATAPRNASGMPVGVAYNANLVSYRASSDVVLNGYHEQVGVQNAFTALGNRSDVRIISMSMGHIFSVGRIVDAVRYANNRGKLIFCAGGTSTSFTTFVGVIFPAWMPETVAVTGIKEASTYQKCDVCHTGSEIDFTIIMQRAGTNNTIPVLSYYNLQADYVGGSSVATATTAGIAALVWARNPGWSKDQVLLKMRQSSQFFPTKHSQFGHGVINAALAVQ